MIEELSRALGRIEGKLDGIEKTTAEISEKVEGHSNRLGSLEGFKGQLMAVAAIIGGTISFAYDFLRQKFGA